MRAISVLVVCSVFVGMTACSSRQTGDSTSERIRTTTDSKQERNKENKKENIAEADTEDLGLIPDGGTGQQTPVQMVDENYTFPDDESWRYVEIEAEEEYSHEEESPFKDVMTSPLSTFSADVDTASYSNMRRFIQNGQTPEGVRVEEFINYFDYDFSNKPGNDEHPFTVHAEVAECPWERNNGLAMISIQGENLSQDQNMANNIVFLIDVSGSMGESNKLPLLQASFKLLIEELDEEDIVSIVTYAGSEKVVADSISGDRKRELNRKIDSLMSGGSTAGAAGITTAYELAEKNFIEDGNNRIILATDGDFNVGVSSGAALEELIEEKRESGVFLTVLGYGMYNLKDNRMELLADKGNGNYAYIDTLDEARKVLVHEFDSTMYTIAKDVKFQVEFNPEVVSEYRLIGYDNRRLENEDFENDLKDAGEIGAGHTVTAFYEIKFTDGEAGGGNLKYQQSVSTGSDELMTVSIRYKKPDGDQSILTETVIDQENYNENPSTNFQFASAVAEFALILKNSEYRGNATLNQVIGRAEDAIGEDEFGLRQEFVELVEMYQGIVD